jgi:hypothetical protein
MEDFINMGYTNSRPLETHAGAAAGVAPVANVSPVQVWRGWLRIAAHFISRIVFSWYSTW